MSIDIHHLEVFCKCAELGSFSEAALVLGIKQSTISTHIRTVESEIGVQLFDRRKNRIHLAPAGEILYQKGLKVIASRREAIASVNNFLGRIEGKIRVGSSTTPAAYILPDIISDFMKIHPKVVFQLATGNTGSILQDICLEKVEIGAVGSVPDKEQFTSCILGYDELLLTYSPVHFPQIVEAEPCSAANQMPLQPSLTALRTRCHCNRALQPCEQNAIATSQPAASRELDNTSSRVIIQPPHPNPLPQGRGSRNDKPCQPESERLPSRLNTETLTLSRMKEFPFILREEGSGTRRLVESVFSQRNLSQSELKVVAEMGSIEAVKRAVIAGMGISFIPKVALKFEIDAQILKAIPLSDAQFTRNFYLVHLLSKTLSPAAQALWNFVENVGKSIQPQDP